MEDPSNHSSSPILIFGMNHSAVSYRVKDRHEQPFAIAGWLWTTRVLDDGRVALGIDLLSVHDIETGKNLFETARCGNYVNGIVSPDHDQVVVADGSGTLSHFDLRASAAAVRKIEKAHADNIRYACLLPHRTQMEGGRVHFATVSIDHCSKVWDWSSWRSVATLSGPHHKFLTSVAEMQDGSVVTGGLRAALSSLLTHKLLSIDHAYASFVPCHCISSRWRRCGCSVECRSVRHED